MSAAGFVLRAPAVWGSLVVLVLTTVLAAVQPAPLLFVLVGLCIVTFVVCGAARLTLLAPTVTVARLKREASGGDHQRGEHQQGTRRHSSEAPAETASGKRVVTAPVEMTGTTALRRTR